MQTVVVLEDSPERVKWLRANTEARVVWAKTVQELHAALTKEAPDLVILDHDLGEADMAPPAPDDPPFPPDYADGEFESMVRRGVWKSGDLHGQDGRDACRTMRLPGCHVLVCSVNPITAPVMVEILQRRGILAWWVPFHSVMASTVVQDALAVMRRT